MSKKQLYSIIVSIFIIVVLIIYWKFAFKTISTNYPIKKAEKKATTSNTTNQTEKKVSHNSKANFFSLREYKNFFEDVPCKESFIIYNYLSELFNDPKVREQTHQKIAVKLAKDGYLDKAIDFAMQIDDQNIRDETLSKIVNELTKTGAIEKALDISNSIQGEPEKSKAIQYIADFLIDKGDLEKASSLTEKMQDSEEPWNPKTKSESIAKIAKKIFDTSTFDEAMKIANSIPDWETQVETIRYFAKEFMEDGERQTAEDIYKKAIELVDSIEIKNKFWNEQLTKYDILNEIAIDLKHAGFKEWSDSIFQRVMKSIENHPYDWIKKMYYRTTAVDLARAGYYEKAIEFADNSGELWNVPETYTDMALELAKLGNFNYSDKFFKKAQDLTGGIDEIYQGRAYTHLVRNLFEAGKFEWACDLSEKLKSPESNYEFLSDMVLNLAKQGLMDVLLSNEDKFFKDKKILSMILNLLDKNGIYDYSDKIFDMLFNSPVSFKDQKEKVQAFYNIAQYLLSLHCEEQEKYIQKFVTVYDMQ